MNPEVENIKNTNYDNTKAKFVMFIFFLFFIAGVFFGFRSYNLVSKGVVDYGKVVDVEKKSTQCNNDSESNCYIYAPIVEYTSNGASKRFTSSMASNNLPSIGEEVKIIYNPDKIEDIEIYSFMTLWFLPILLFSFSIVGFLVIFSSSKNGVSKRIIK